MLGEGGKKKVYLARDNTLDRDIAFALIKTEGLDETSRERVRREAQAMGRMGTHPCIMPIYDLGEEDGQPYMVQPLMGGGDVEGLVEDADGPLSLERALEIATQTAQGLSFAHGKGIVHRDLKPGNVWLDDDGAAKIGDFGLAVATDRSRLTVEKVMVGTVSYMPPEQATGGEVTPRADLYSLGAMLYEMCTGRVPFMGDDDIGIISQHINTPPVAPSWHNTQIPKTLDSLILRLLAKDPRERPESADEVLAALGAVDLTTVEEDQRETETSLDSMAGGVFVGRHREMDHLKGIFEQVLSGRGRMVTLIGEPGIGKTRTAQELATYAGMRGASVLWGRSYESGGAPPYWPWVQAIRSYVTATEPNELRSQVGDTASVISEIIPTVRTALPEVQPPPIVNDPESRRFRLFDSISTFFKQVASVKPVVLMLEDLHWSDKPSLMLLEFVVRELANCRMLIVGNYRDVELNRRHPLAVTLGELTRERLFERVVLRGLQRHDVERFIEIAAGINPPPALVDAVHSQTEGNPLFITETVRLLIQEGDIASGQAARSGTTSWEIRIPEGVREVIGRRLDRLSVRCNDALTIAAVIGRQFRFKVLKMLFEDTTEVQLLDAMDEALSARIVEELPEELGLYQFTHASMQETLASELSLTRRVRLHARIVDTLEEFYGDKNFDHAAELAGHSEHAETLIGPDKLIKYSMAAGHSAMRVSAFHDAHSYFQKALAVKLREERDLDLARILEGYGHAGGALNHLDGEALACIWQAFDIYAELGESESAIRVAKLPLPSYGDPRFVERLEVAIKLAEPNSSDAGWLYSRHGGAQGVSPHYDLESAERSFEMALSIARESHESALEMWTLGRIAQVYSGHAKWSSALEHCRLAIALAPSANDLEAHAHSTFWAARTAATLGNLEAARRYAGESLEVAEKSRTRYRTLLARHESVVSSILAGDWIQAERNNKLVTDFAWPSSLTQDAMMAFLRGPTAAAMNLLKSAVDAITASPVVVDGEAVIASDLLVCAGLWSGNQQLFLDAQKASKTEDRAFSPVGDLHRSRCLALAAAVEGDSDQVKAIYHQLAPLRGTASRPVGTVFQSIAFSAYVPANWELFRMPQTISQKLLSS